MSYMESSEEAPAPLPLFWMIYKRPKELTLWKEAKPFTYLTNYHPSRQLLDMNAAEFRQSRVEQLYIHGDHLEDLCVDDSALLCGQSIYVLYYVHYVNGSPLALVPLLLCDTNYYHHSF